DYSLVVTRNAEFDTEANSDLGSAQAVVSTKVAGQQSVLGFVGRSGAGDPSQVRGAAYVTSIGGEPWGSDSNIVAMDRVFGAGNWEELRFETVDAAALFSDDHEFVYLDGSDFNADALEAFLTANQALIEGYVAAGHTLFVNAAPNVGDGMSFGFGDVTLV